MVVRESQGEQLPPSVSLGRGNSQQYRSNPCIYGSNGNISAVNTSIHYEPQECTERDFLLPVKLYGTSRSSRSIRPKDAGGSSSSAETVCSMVLQILVPFLLAGLGTVSAGMLLEVVQVTKQTQKKQKKRGWQKRGLECRWSTSVVFPYVCKLEMKRDVEMLGLFWCQGDKGKGWLAFCWCRMGFCTEN